MKKLARHQWSPNSSCYYCGAKTTTKEHAPPKALFKRVDCDMITVPACDEHNSEKSLVDKAVLAAMAKVVLEDYKIRPSDGKLTKNVMETAAHIENSFKEVSELVTWKGFYTDTEPWQVNDMVYFRSTLYILDWVRQLTAALLWHIIGRPQETIEWDYVEVYNPYLHTEGPYEQDDSIKAFLNNEAKKAGLDSLTWYRGWSAHPRAYPRDIFRFDLAFDETETWPDANIIFRHTLFNGVTIFYIPIRVDSESFKIILEATA